MSSPGSAQPTDYYAALGLNPAAPPHALLAQLSHRIAQTTIGPERTLMEQARAILGDPAKRQIYDARLRDPQAPSWTPHELHELAMAQPGRPAASGLGAQLAAIPRRVLAAVAGGLAVLLVLVITVASCAGGNGDDAAFSAHDSTVMDSGGNSRSDDQIRPNARLRGAEWKSVSDTPSFYLRLVEAYALPSDIATGLKECSGDRCSLAQYQDKNIGVVINNNTPGYDSPAVAIFTPDGALVSSRSYENGATPEAFDLQKKARQGYFRITASDGIVIPAGSNGSEPEMHYGLAVLADAFDKTAVWLLLRDGTHLFKANIH